MCCVACSSTRTQQQPTLYIVHIYFTKKGKSSHEWECDDYEWDFMFIFIIMWAEYNLTMWQTADFVKVRLLCFVLLSEYALFIKMNWNVFLCVDGSALSRESKVE